jgi:hypothetical protein
MTNAATTTANETDRFDSFGNDNHDVTGLPVRGVFEAPEGFIALTYSQSATFKTRAGAERWYARKTAR